MKLTDKQKQLYDEFYESTHNDGILDPQTESLVGLAAAMASNCEPCTVYYFNKCKENKVSKAQMQAVLAKVMAVAAGQKRLQAERILADYNIDFDSFA